MRKNQSGFTLLEIMLVVTIIALLMAAAIYKMGPGNVAYARHTKIQGDIQTIGTQLSLYENMNGFRPTTDQGIQALVTQPTTDPQPQRWYQLFKDLPKDPWNNNRAGFTATTQLNRKDYGIIWNKVMDAGGYMLG